MSSPIFSILGVRSVYAVLNIISDPRYNLLIAQKSAIEPLHLIEIDHGSDMDDDPARFRTTITFDEQSDGKTVITLRQLHPTKAQRDRTIGFGAVEYGYQTLDKLARHVETVTG
jgi:uncharacterized protein YndB with AHSA1/START domain